MLLNVTYRFNCCLAHAEIFKPIQSGTNLDWDFPCNYLFRIKCCCYGFRPPMPTHFFPSSVSSSFHAHWCYVELFLYSKTIVNMWQTNGYSRCAHNISLSLKIIIVNNSFKKAAVFLYLMVVCWPLCVEMISIWTCIHIEMCYLTLKRTKPNQTKTATTKHVVNK